MAAQQPHELLIDGRLYDVQKFQHPGGSVIKYLTGSGDASEAFTEFHYRSEKALKVLSRLPNRPAPPTPPPTKALVERESRMKKMTADFAKLRKELVDEGWFRPAPLHFTYRVVEIVVMHALGIYLLLSTPYWLPALAVLGIASGRCGWLMHEAGHYSFSGNIKFDKRMQELIYGVGCGMSGAWWRNQHNKHHATPQKLRHDVDLDTLPLVAFHAAVGKAAKNSPLMRKWLSLQAYSFGPLTCLLVALFWQFFLHPRHMLRTKRFAELFWLAVRFAAITAVAIAADATWGEAVLCYLLYDLFGGAYIFTNFALSHTHLGVTAPDEHVHWIEYAGTYTINISNTFAVNWWMGYLNFQIEHHLFPSMPQFRFPKLSPRIRRLFAENGVAYDVRDYFQAMRDTFSNLDNVAHAIG